MVYGRLWNTVDTMCQTNGNMLDRTYAYSCSTACPIICQNCEKAAVNVAQEMILHNTANTLSASESVTAATSKVQQPLQA